MFAIANSSVVGAASSLFARKGYKKKIRVIDNDIALRNSLSTVDILASVAWSLAVLSLTGIAVYAVLTDMVLTASNVALGVTAVIAFATVIVGRRKVDTISGAKRLRNMLIVGNALTMLAFGAAMVMLGIQATAWFLFYFI